MKNILFRGKRTDNKGWVNGLLTIMWGQYHIINPYDENTAYQIDPETVCQYTGLTDKNGKKLFERDIVKEESDVGIVKFGNYGNGFHYGFYIDWLTCPNLRPELAFWNGRVERIGNVFEDQELLKGYGVKNDGE